MMETPKIDRWEASIVAGGATAPTAGAASPGGAARTAESIAAKHLARVADSPDAALSAALAVSAGAAWRDRICAVGADWYTTPPPVRQWLLRDDRRPDSAGFFPRGKAGQLIAEGGAGKTMALLQLAVAIATGDPWLGAFSVERPGRAFLLLGEEDAEEARRRIYAATRDAVIKPPDGAIVVASFCGVPCALLDRDSGGHSVETEFAAWLRAYLVETGPWDLLCFDPLSRLGGPDCELDNAVATRFVQSVEAIVEATGASAVVAHHTNKASRVPGGPVTGSASRGATALHDGFRWQVSLAVADGGDLGEIVTLAHTKKNYSRKAEPLELRRGDGGVLVALTEGESSALAVMRSGADGRRKRVAEKEAIRDETQAARAAKVAAKREEGERAKAAKVAAVRETEDRALVAILRASPGILSADLRSALAAALGSCSHDRAANAVARLGAAVVKATPPDGARNAIAHSLDEARLSEGLR